MRGPTTALKKTLLVATITVLVLFLVLLLVVPLPPLKPYSTVVYDRNGVLLHAFLSDDGAWRLKTHPQEISEKLKRILIEKEDRFFYYHPGVNPLSIIRAAIQNIRRGKRLSGASTITMQVARMLEPKERTYVNKIIEMFRALQLELRYSKEEILELYLSMVPVGGNIEGLKSAALLYYQQPPERLNIAHLLDLILLPNDPARLRPDRYAGQLYSERLRRASGWITSGLLSAEDSLVIVQTAAGAERGSVPRLAPHFSLRMREQTPGMPEVRTTLSLASQQTAERLLQSNLRPWKDKGVRNGAVLVVRNSNREVLAYVGSEDFHDAEASGQVDAVVALRSPGSTLKPFLYAQAMDRGILTPRTILIDTPYDAEGFYAENYDGTYDGLIYADDALRRSLNVPMIRLLQKVGIASFVDFLAQAGLESIDAQRNKLGLSMIVGGCGVTLEELVRAYGSLPNAGRYAPLCYLRGEAEHKSTAGEIITPAAAYMITEILSGLDRPDIPGNIESSLDLPTVAYKTGTSYGRRDAWAIGYSAEFTIGVWIGNVTNAGNPELVGSRAAAPLLIDLFNALSSPHQKDILAPPDDLGIREVCARSGLLPTSNCTRRIADYYSIARTLNRVCDVDKEFMISQKGDRHYCPTCVGSNKYVVTTFPDYPPEVCSFWKRKGVVYRTPPPHNPDCPRVFAGQGPVILSPSDRTTYYVVSDQQRLALHASSGLDVHEHIWYVDREFRGRKRAGERIFVALNEGLHTLTCTDNKGRSSTISVTIKRALE